MDNRIMKFVQAGVFFIVTVLIVSSATAMAPISPKSPFSLMTKMMVPVSDSFKGETELKFYNEENLSQLIGIDTTELVVWKTAIRLTQDEMAVYTEWTMTEVNVAFSVANDIPTMNVRIYIYDKGTSTNPGAIIVNDTTFNLDTTGVTTIPLVTPVNLSGHEELWVAVEWTQHASGPDLNYAWLDDITGPAIPNKSDWVYLNNVWGQLHSVAPTLNGRWGIGAIIEGQGTTQLAIGNIKGPIGIKADVSNIGATDANNVQWSIAVTGGLLKRVNATAIGTTASLVAGASTPMNSGIFFGFGKINIDITAKAQNAFEVTATKTAFLFGPFVVGIR